MNHNKNTPSSSEINIATCPACGLLCDDITYTKSANNTIKVQPVLCAKSVQFFEQKSVPCSPRIKGEPVTLNEAITEIALILNNAKSPKFFGLSTDLNGFRSLFSLAKKTNAYLEHMNNAIIQRNVAVLQNAGWITTTLTETKNRADVIVFIGTDGVSANPRLFERIIWNKNSLFTEPKNRKIIYLGGKDLDTSPGTSPHGQKATVLSCTDEKLPDVIATLNAIIAKKALKNIEQVDGIDFSDLHKLADTLLQAKYAVIAWAPKCFDYPHAELTIQQIINFIATLNQSTRAAGISLGGSDGDVSANNANTWLSGLALNQVDSVDHDAMIWINSFSMNIPIPKTNAPLIVLGNQNLQFDIPPHVFIPIATPGLDCHGTLLRLDNVVSLPLKKAHENDLPTLTQVVARIMQNTLAFSESGNT